MLILKSIFLIFIFSFLTSLFYLVCGLILNQNNKNNYLLTRPNSLYFHIFSGSILLSLIALIIHFFYPLNVTVNTTVFIITFFILIFKFRHLLKKKYILKLIYISIASTLFLSFSNINRPDAALYHLPYISYLNEHKIILGISNIHFRFGHISVLQYLSALNYNFLFGLNGISIPLSIISLAIIFYFLETIIKKDQIKSYDIEFFFIFFVLIFIFYKMIRYSAYGNDNTTHLLYFFLISICLNNNYSKNTLLLSSIAIFTFLNKTTYFLVLLIPVLFFFKNKDYKNINIIKKNIFAVHTFLLIFWITKNILSTGCAIYPISKTCFYNLSWADNVKNTKQVELSGEAWSKGWPQSDQKLKEEYFIKNFNWIESWLQKHAKYTLKIIAPFILVLILIVFYLKRDSNCNIHLLKKNWNYYNLLTLNFLFLIIFFLKFPLLRYGLSYLIVTLILILIFLLNKISINKTNFIIKKFIIFFAFVFISKQILKIHDKIKIDYINKPWPNIYSLDNKKIYEKNIFLKEDKIILYYSKNECGYSNAICTNYPNNLIVKKLNQYYIVLI